MLIKELMALREAKSKLMSAVEIEKFFADEYKKAGQEFEYSVHNYGSTLTIQCENDKVSSEEIRSFLSKMNKSLDKIDIHSDVDSEGGFPVLNIHYR